MTRPPLMGAARVGAVLAAVLLSNAGCSAGDEATGPGGIAAQRDNPQCLPLPLAINTTDTRKDGIPALSNPDFVAVGHPGAAYVSDDTRVVGVVLGGEPLAVPLNVLWWHEIVNVSRGGSHAAITFCPLTGSSLVFDRQAIRGQELGVSGLLYDNNLIMFDRSSNESLWGQMLGQAICGPAKGEALTILPSLETSFREWQRLFPATKVASGETGFDRDYAANPYEDYWRLDAPAAFSERPPDRRRPPKERVLVLPDGAAGGIALPFGDRAAERREALVVPVGSEEWVVFWDGRSQTAAAYSPKALWASGFEGPKSALSFDAGPDGYTDRETGTLWSLDGRAVSGPGERARLKAHPGAFVAFWFAWVALRPTVQVYPG